MEKHIEIGGKDYYFAPTRKIVKVIYNISPKYLQLHTGKSKPTSEDLATVYVDLLDRVDEIAHCLLVSYEGQEGITKKQSDEILKQMELEYGMLEAGYALIDLAMSVFTEGEQGSAKKKLILK